MRRGFTLTELLIVISIIAILAGLLMPALSLVRRQANTVKCSSNLHQIALALEVYRQDHGDTFPGKLSELLADGFDAKCFICPFDVQRGADPYMGRNPAWNSYNKLHRDTTSYCYEVSGWIDPNPDGSTNLLSSGDIAYFYRDQTTLPPVGQESWGTAKLHQQKFGNLRPGVTTATGPSSYGASFPPDNMPIVRCYWHSAWPAGGGDLNMPRKVNNISLGFNTFWSIPFWELEVNPNIPHN